MKSNIENIKIQIETEINNSLSQKFLTSNNFFLDSFQLSQADFSELLQSVKHIISSGGKRWRAVLLVLCFEACNKNTAKSKTDIFKLASVVEFIHTASLIHDDIEDSSELRRGKPAAHIKFGLDTALNSGSWLYFHALHLLQSTELSNEKKYFINEIVTQGIYNLHLGQALDISWHRDENFFPSPTLYEKMIRLKTGTLAGLAGAIGVYSATADKELAQNVSNALHELGIAFQIIDDIKNITTGIIGKDKGDDIVEGKKSLPVIFFVQKHPNKKAELSSYFKTAKQNGINSSAVQNAITLLNSSDCIVRAKNYAHEKITKAKNALANTFKPSPKLDTLLAFLDAFV